ncbi:MAG TPA: sulfotransferase [Lacipirellulaceae bacterium]|nr:sulfotransferase [Lacipirellulaceae bacterium]
MSVIAPPAPHPPASPVVKHPMAWYMPRFWHGMRLSTWLRELARNRFDISPGRIPMVCSITGFTALNSLLSAVDQTVNRRRVREAQLRESPLFILGHWRAGTTFLHELLIRDPDHAYPTTYRCFAPHHFVLTERFITPWSGFLLPARRPMDNMAAGWERPQEDEFALANLGAPTPYLSMMFPNRGPQSREYLTLRELPAAQREQWKAKLLLFLKRLSVDGPRRIVVKSPGHTARVRTLLELFPQAKFVHLSRDPFSLYRSTMGLWQALHVEETLQTIRDERWLGPEIVRTLREMYDAYFEDRELLGDDQLVELSYEELIDDPKGQVQRIYRQLQLGDPARLEAELDRHLTEVRNYRTNRHALEDATCQMLRREWTRYFDEFGYE